MGDENVVAEAAVQLVTNFALSCASLIVDAEKGLLGRDDLDQAHLKEWIDSFLTRRRGSYSTPSSAMSSNTCGAKPNAVWDW